MCEECDSCHDRTRRPVLEGQSVPLFEPASLLMKTHTPSTEDPSQEDLLQRYQERVEKLSQQDRVIKFCTDAGFLTTVEVGQYFMTKDTGEFSQFTDSVACREYTLPRDEHSSGPKGWIRGNIKIAPVLEVTTSYLQGKYGVETRIESTNKDHSHSWVRISHGLKKLVTDLNNKEHDDNEQEPILNHKIIRPLIIQCRRNWSIFFVMVVHLEKMMERLNSGDLKVIFGTILCILNIGLMKSGKSQWQKGGNKKRFQYCTDPSRQEILYLRALQGHSGRNIIDPSLQDNVLIPDDFFESVMMIGNSGFLWLSMMWIVRNSLSMFQLGARQDLWNHVHQNLLNRALGEPQAFPSSSSGVFVFLHLIRSPRWPRVSC